jgi:tetratricopeptide (TPR) repeat protein
MRSFSFEVLLVFLLVISTSLSAAPADSLRALLAKARTNQEKLDLQLQLSADAMTRDFNSALEYGQQAVFLAKVIDKPEEQIRAYKNLATVFFYAGMIDQAIESLLTCKEHASQSNNAVELLNANLNLGVMRLGVEDYKKARAVFIEGDSLIHPTYRKLGTSVPTQDLVTLYTNIGLCSILLNEVQDGYVYLQKALVLLDTAKLPELLRAKVLQAWGIGLTKEKKSDEAVVKLLEAGALLEKLGEQVQLVGLNSFIGQAYEAKGDFENAILAYRIGFAGSQGVNSLYYKKQFAEALYQLFEKQHKNDSSYKYLRLFNQYRKETNAVKAREELARQELLQAFTQREIEFKKEESRRRYLLLGILLIVLGISAGLFWGLMRHRKHLSKASLQKMRLELEAEKLEIEKEILQARVNSQDAEIAKLNYKFSRNEVLNQLVDDLQQSEGALLPEDEQDQSLSPQQSKLWKDFEFRFLQMHDDFYEKLMAVCPDLTQNERRLCAFLKMDMSTKEISVITGQSIRSINMARFRLRKKLELTNSDTSVFEFLAGL